MALRRPPSAAGAEQLRRLIRAAGPGSGRGAAPYGGQGAELLHRLYAHYEAARSLVMADLQRDSERQLRRQYEQERERIERDAAEWRPAFRAAVRSGDVAQLRAAWRDSDGFKYAVARERNKLRQATLRLGFTIEPRLFGASAAAIAEREAIAARADADAIPLEVPRFLDSVLARLAALGAAATEGIFRVPADATELKAVAEMFESDELTLATDPRCAALDVFHWSNLLTRWLRQLAEPLITAELYDTCVELGSEQLTADDEGRGAVTDDLAEHAAQIVAALPAAHRAIIVRLIRFLRSLDPFVTKMTTAALSVVFAPSLLRHPDLMTAAQNFRAEAAFTQLLLSALPIAPEPVSESEEESEPEPEPESESDDELQDDEIQELVGEESDEEEARRLRMFSRLMVWEWQEVELTGTTRWREYQPQFSRKLEQAYRQYVQQAVGAPSLVPAGRRRIVDLRRMRQLHVDSKGNVQENQWSHVRRIAFGGQSVGIPKAMPSTDPVRQADDLQLFAKSPSPRGSAEITALESPTERDSADWRNRGQSRLTWSSDLEAVEGLEAYQRFEQRVLATEAEAEEEEEEEEE
eukprot:COSAG04_NODE_3921_length_2420_cov_736.458854_1_plen_581_part_10